jgi:hypothetical protein
LFLQYSLKNGHLQKSPLINPCGSIGERFGVKISIGKLSIQMSLYSKKFTVIGKHLWITIVTKGTFSGKAKIDNPPKDRGIHWFRLLAFCCE